jgi:dTDP-4-dehydrorhamnose 3,5-epimerase
VKFEKTAVDGAYIIRPEPRADERGYFARIWCHDELAAQGLNTAVAQINIGSSPKSGTLRGMHYQLPPHAEVKITRCTRGAVFDVLIDLRRSSPTYRKWVGVNLTANDGAMLYVPTGCAHGYLTLEPNSELIYLTSQTYAAASARGVRHDDLVFAIKWPSSPQVISSQDAGWPEYTDDAAIDVRGAGR